MNIRELLNRSGGRKLVSSGLLFITSTAILIADIGNVDFMQWCNFNIILLGIYIGGNLGAKLSARKMEK